MVASCTPLTGDMAQNPGMGPDWESNWQPFGSQASTQSTEPHQPVQFFKHIKSTYLFLFKRVVHLMKQIIETSSVRWFDSCWFTWPWLCLGVTSVGAQHVRTDHSSPPDFSGWDTGLEELGLQRQPCSGVGESVCSRDWRLDRHLGLGSPYLKLRDP